MQKLTSNKQVKTLIFLSKIKSRPLTYSTANIDDFRPARTQLANHLLYSKYG